MVLAVNGPGPAFWEGAQGAIYVIAQTPSDPTRLRFATASEDEWFTPGGRAVWQEAPQRLE